MKTISSPAYTRHIKWLRELREVKKMTQADLAARLRRPQSFVAKVEGCERKLDVLEYVLWMEALREDPGKGIQKLSDAVASRAGLRKRVLS